MIWLIGGGAGRFDGVGWHSWLLLNELFVVGNGSSSVMVVLVAEL